MSCFFFFCTGGAQAQSLCYRNLFATNQRQGYVSVQEMGSYQLILIPANNVSVFKSSTVQSIVCTFAITAEVTNLACR